MSVINVLLTLVFYIQLTCGRLPDGSFPKCNRKDPNLSQCLVRGVEAIRPMVARGIPSVGLPPLEPFKFDRVNIASQTGMPGFTIQGVLGNVVVNGLSGFKIKDLRFDRHNHDVTMEIIIPHVKVSARYNTRRARAFFMLLESRGQLMGKLNNIVATAHLRGTVENRNGLDYVKIPFIKLKINIGQNYVLHVKPDNTGPRPTKVLTDMLKKMGRPVLLKILNSSVNNEIVPIIKKYVNKITDAIPLQDLLTEKS